MRKKNHYDVELFIHFCWMTLVFPRFTMYSYCYTPLIDDHQVLFYLLNPIPLPFPLLPLKYLPLALIKRDDISEFGETPVFHSSFGKRFPLGDVLPMMPCTLSFFGAYCRANTIKMAVSNIHESVCCSGAKSIPRSKKHTSFCLTIKYYMASRLLQWQSAWIEGVSVYVGDRGR